MFSWFKEKIKSLFSKTSKVKTRSLWKYKFTTNGYGWITLYAKPRFSFFKYIEYERDWLSYHDISNPQIREEVKKQLESRFFKPEKKHKRRAWLIVHAAGMLAAILASLLVVLFAISFPNAAIIFLLLSCIVALFIYTLKNL